MVSWFNLGNLSDFRPLPIRAQTKSHWSSKFSLGRSFKQFQTVPLHYPIKYIRKPINLIFQTAKCRTCIPSSQAVFFQFCSSFNFCCFGTSKTCLVGTLPIVSIVRIVIPIFAAIIDICGAQTRRVAWHKYGITFLGERWIGHPGISYVQ